jgi:hypothetical protein
VAEPISRPPSTLPHVVQVPLNNIGLKTHKIELVHWTNGADPVRLIEDPEHPMYKKDTLKNFVPDEIVVKVGEQLALRDQGSLHHHFSRCCWTFSHRRATMFWI